jgi:hypothetical protein
LTASFVGVDVFPVPNPSPSTWAFSASGLFSMTVKDFKIYSKEVSESRNYGGKWKKMLEAMGYSNKYGDV